MRPVYDIFLDRLFTRIVYFHIIVDLYVITYTFVQNVKNHLHSTWPQYLQSLQDHNSSNAGCELKYSISSFWISAFNAPFIHRHSAKILVKQCKWFDDSREIWTRITYTHMLVKARLEPPWVPQVSEYSKSWHESLTNHFLDVYHVSRIITNIVTLNM